MNNKIIIGILIVIAAIAAIFLTDKDQKLDVASCGDVKIADMNWDSASLMANIDKVILTEGYGCNATLVPEIPCLLLHQWTQKVNQI